MRKVIVRRPNMSNQFYDYLSEKLFKYFEDNLVKGEKFFINFEDVYFDKDRDQYNENPVMGLYKSLEKLGKLNGCFDIFEYKHEKGKKCYKSFLLHLNNINLVVVENMHARNGFISLLRNLIKDQLNEWNNSSLLIISQKANDTISKGTSNLRDDGMPLSVSVISANLSEEIDSSDLNFQEKYILHFSLDGLNKQFSKNIWHYKSILSIIKKGKIDKSDLYNLNLFPDSNLDDYRTKSDIEDRLNENNKLFMKIPWLKEDEDKKELKRTFDDEGMDLLDSENWYESDYALLLRSITKSQKKYNDPLKYKVEAGKEIVGELSCWDIPNSKTQTGNRTRNIIIFNNKKLDEISFKLKFNKYTSGDCIGDKCKSFVFSTGKRLDVNFKVDSNETTFKKIIYVPKNDKKENISSQRHVFNVAVINASEDLFKSIKHNFKITGSKQHLLITIDDIKEEKIIFGQDTENCKEVMIEDESDVLLNEVNSIYISEFSDWNDNSLSFNLLLNNFKIPFEIKKKSKDFPKYSSFIWNKKRELKSDFKFDGIKVIQNNNMYNVVDEFKKYLNYEKDIISNKVIFGNLVEGELVKKEISISKEIKKAYEDIFDYFDRINNVPSLVYINDELKKLYSNLIDIFNFEVDNITETSLAENKNNLNLIKLGRIETNDEILYSSLSPINIAYQLEILDEVGDEPLESIVYEKLTPRNLIPYIYSTNSNILFKQIFHTIHEWLIFREEEKVSIGTSNKFTSETVKKMLVEFKKHFPYLFINQKSDSLNIFDNNIGPSIKINVIDINDDTGVIAGIFYFILENLEENNNINGLVSVDLNIYNNTGRSNFDKFFRCNSKEQLRDEFKINFKDINSYDSSEIIRLVQDNINYSIHSSDDDYEYAHISFYKVKLNSKIDQENDIIAYDHEKLETGLYLNGLLSSVTSTNDNSSYRTGFGTKNILDSNNNLIKTAVNMNILAENSKKDGKNSFSRNLSIVTMLNLQDDNLDKIYRNSRWVTFMDPNFGIEYFEDPKGGVILVHYSDQYTSSDKYDTITVTNRIDHYKYLIKDFLNPTKWEMDPKRFPEDLTPLLRMFNCINGEWLLDIISNTSEHNPEKLSFLSAIKYCLAILDHEDIIWIPVSMEELLRISGSYKLAKSEGLISKMKERTGVHSDDLLFIGLKFNEGDIELLFFPIEVKVGYNYSNVIDKGENQLISANNFFKDILSKETEHKFRNKVFRNYFIQRFLSNKQNFVLNSLWPEKNLDRIDEFKCRLLNDDFKVSWYLEEYVGKGYLVSFQRDLAKMSIDKKDEISIIRLPKSFVFNGLTDSIEEIKNNFHSEGSEFDTKDFLKNKLTN